MHTIIDMHIYVHIIQLETDEHTDVKEKITQGKKVFACLWHQLKNKYDNKNHHKMAYGMFLYTYYSLIFFLYLTWHWQYILLIRGAYISVSSVC